MAILGELNRAELLDTSVSRIDAKTLGEVIAKTTSWTAA